MLYCADEFRKRLDRFELTYKILRSNEKEVIISVRHKGKPYVCIFEDKDGRILTIKLFIGKVPEERTAKAIICANEINSKYKWVRLFVDEYNDLMAISEMVLTPSTAAAYTSELLVDRLIGILEEKWDLIDEALNG